MRRRGKGAVTAQTPEQLAASVAAGLAAATAATAVVAGQVRPERPSPLPALVPLLLFVEVYVVAAAAVIVALISTASSGRGSEAGWLLLALAVGVMAGYRVATVRARRARRRIEADLHAKFQRRLDSRRVTITVNGARLTGAPGQ